MTKNMKKNMLAHTFANKYLCKKYQNKINPKKKKTKKKQLNKLFYIVQSKLHTSKLKGNFISLFIYLFIYLTNLFIGLAYQGEKDIVFRFIIEYSRLRDFGLPR